MSRGETYWFPLPSPNTTTPVERINSEPLVGHITRHPLGYKNKLASVGVGRLQGCLLRATVAQFYLDELKYFFARLNNGWNKRITEYYRKLFEEHAMIIIRFCITAITGELRYLWFFENNDEADCDNCCREDCDGEDCDYENDYWEPDYLYYGKEADKARNKLEQTLEERTPISHDKFRPRQSVYNDEPIPEEMWVHFLEVAIEIFDSKLWIRDRGFGGKAWKRCAEVALKLYKSLCDIDTSKIIFWTDRVVNAIHNGGLFLNKFDCISDMTLEKCLEAHKFGSLEYLKFYAGFKCQWSHCRLTIRI